MVEFLKTQPYAKIIDERRPSAGLAKSIEEAQSGKVTTAKTQPGYWRCLKNRICTKSVFQTNT